MFKKSLCAILVYILILSSVCGVYADGGFSLSELGKCSYLYSYSGKSCAYFYGNSNYTLYSARVIPNRSVRYVGVSGYISAVCHDENCAYALYKAGSDSLGVVRMNMNNGKCDYCTLNNTKLMQKNSFAVAGNEIFIIFSGNSYPYIKCFDFSGKYLRSYTFPAGAECLFCNGGYVYARTFSGEIFRLSGANKTKYADCAAYKGFSDAGAGYIHLNDKQLVSLSGGKIQPTRSEFAVITNTDSFYLSGTTLRFNKGETDVSSPKLVCAVGSTAAVLGKNLNCQIINANSAASQSQSAQSNKLKISGKVIVGIEANSTVAKIKEQYPEIKKIYNHDGSEITSGKLKTGYSAQTQSGTYKLAVRGDVNSSGTLNTADTDELMKALAGASSLSDCCGKAADYNFDGTANTKDLVLIGKKIKDN